MTMFNVRNWEGLKENILKPSVGINIFVCVCVCVCVCVYINMCVWIMYIMFSVRCSRYYLKLVKYKD